MGNAREGIMLFEFDPGTDVLKPVRFLGFEDIDRVEKQLEDLLAKHLFGVLFEEPPLLPFFQERLRQSEADIYALTEDGDVVVLELKRSQADVGALIQALGYAQEAGTWRYGDIEDRFRQYMEDREADLAKAHQQQFGLEKPLLEDAFNQAQHIWVIGNAADGELRRAIDYWKRKGLSIDFFPYRVYRFDEKYYFEFVAKPYDAHANPGDEKGVLFDTNRTYSEDALRWMMEKRRVSTFGGNDAVKVLKKGDIVFYSHGGVGVVAAARVLSKRPKRGSFERGSELFHDVELLTSMPERFDQPKALSFRRVQEITGRRFWWATTAKVPYLTPDEAKRLLGGLTDHLRVLDP